MESQFIFFWQHLHDQLQLKIKTSHVSSLFISRNCTYIFTDSPLFLIASYLTYLFKEGTNYYLIPRQLRGCSTTKRQAIELDRLRSEIEEHQRRVVAADEWAIQIAEEFSAQKELIKSLQEQQLETRGLYEELVAQMKDLRKWQTSKKVR